MVDRAQRARGDGDDLVAAEQCPLARGLGRAQPLDLGPQSVRGDGRRGRRRAPAERPDPALDLLLAEDRVERDEPDLRAGLLVERGEGGVLDLEVQLRRGSSTLTPKRRPANSNSRSSIRSVASTAPAIRDAWYSKTSSAGGPASRHR